MRATDDRRHPRLDQLLQARGVVAERLDGDTEDIFMWSARNREGMPVPAILGFEIDHCELAGHELDLSADRP
jgi:hypothetical protein